MKQRLHRRASDSARSVPQEIVLTLTAALGMVIFAGAALMLALGVKPLVFLSGSMEPAIATGALALTITVPAGELREGDVISFLRSDGARVTHRVAELTPQGESFEIITRGDANETDDAEPLYIAAADRVFWHLDGAGAALTEATKFQYVFPFGVLVGMAALYGFRRVPARIAHHDEAPETSEKATGATPARRTGPARAWAKAGLPALGVITALAVGAAGMGAPTPTLAAFTATGAGSAEYSSAADFLAPAVVDAGTITCSAQKTLLGTDVTFSWQAPIGTVTSYDTELVLEDNPLLYHATKSTTATTVTYALSADLLYNGRYRFAVTSTNDGRTNGTAYKTVDYSMSTVTCS